MSRSATEPQKPVWCCSKCGAIYHKDFPRCPADGAEVVMSDRDPLIGCAVGHYIIEKLIGEGGMGRVYRAHHTNLPNKLYAFKVLLGDHSASTAMRARFTREAHRASQLDHPNVCKVVDFGETQHGLLYIVMDYVPGKPLVRLVGNTPMSPARTIAIARQVCRGLAHAHDLGIVHRDLKPENILVTDDPTGDLPRIVDFGLALSLDQQDARLTESGMTMGTPAFASPEQLSGRPVDHRADLYALGLVMYEMLTGGVLPFDGHVMEVVAAKTTRDAPRMSARSPGLAIPKDLDDIVAKLTARRADQRYPSARDVLIALDGARIGPEARIATEPVLRRRRRGPRLAAVAALVAAAAATVYLGARAPAGDDAAGVAQRERATRDTATRDTAPRDTASRDTATRDATRDTPSSPSRADASSRDTATRDATRDTPSSPSRADASSRDTAPRDTASHGAASHDTATRDAPEHPAWPAHPHTTSKPAKHRSTHNQRAARPAIVVEQPPPQLPVSPITPAAAPVVPPPAPALPPVELRVTLAGVDVDGSLPANVVQRAVERTLGALGRCVPAVPQTVVAHFRIGESRRAQGVAASPAGAVGSCVAAALAAVRTESAPDVGDVEVTVRIAFVVKT